MKENRRFTRRTQGIVGTALCAALLAVAIPGERSFAASPAFSRTEEEWALLRDNTLEYKEIEDLIAEYNPTVQQNQFSYRRFRKEYGDSRDQVSGEYRRLAKELLSDIHEPDESDPGYAAGMTSALMSELQADALLKQADENLEDSEVIRINYERAEKALTQTAQNNMIAWYTGQNTARLAALSKQLAERSLSVIQTQVQLGMATEAQRLREEQRVQEAEKARIEGQSAAEQSGQKLRIMLGWRVNAEPEMGKLPIPDPARIDQMDPKADLERALNCNYTLRVNRRKRSNALSETDIHTWEITIQDNEARISASLDRAYQNVLSAKNNWHYRCSDASFQAQTAEQTEQQYALGLVSSADRESAAIRAEQAELERQNAEYALLQAMEAYDWAVNGLAVATGNGEGSA